MRPGRFGIVATFTVIAACTGPGFLKQAGGDKPALTGAVVPAGAVTPVAAVPSAAPIAAKVLSDDGEKVVAQLTRGSEQTQTVQASASSSIAQTIVSFPPGALAVDTEIGLEEAAPIVSSALASELGLPDDNALTTAGQPVAVTSTAQADASTPFTLSVALDPSFGAGLALTAPDYALILVTYKVFIAAEGRYVYGLIPNGDLRFDGLLVSFKTSYFGVYQPTVSEKPILTAPPVATASSGILSRREAAAQLAVTWSDVRASFDATNRTLSCSASASAELGKCRALFFDGDGRRVASADSAGPAGASVALAATDTGARRCRFECFDLIGRTTGSDLSAAIEIAAVAPTVVQAKADEVTPGATSPTRSDGTENPPVNQVPSVNFVHPAGDDDYSLPGASFTACYSATDPDDTLAVELYEKVGDDTGCSDDPAANGWSLKSGVSPGTNVTKTFAAFNGAGDVYFCLRARDATHAAYATSDKLILQNPPNAPSAPAAASGNGTITVTWAAPSGGAGSYEVYSRDEPGAGASGTPHAAGSTSFSFPNAVPGKRYYFAVRALTDGGGFPSAFSSEVSAYAYGEIQSTGSHPDAIGVSPERKTFYDPHFGKYWAFSYNGSALEYHSSPDAVTWSLGGTIATTSSHFSLAFKEIGSVPRVFVIAESTDPQQFKLWSGTIAAGGVTFANGVVLAPSGGVYYANPTLTISSDDRLWIAAGRLDKNMWTIRVLTSDATVGSGHPTFNGAPTSPPSPSTSSPTIPALTADASGGIHLVVDTGGALKSYRYNGSWSTAAGDTDAWRRLEGGGSTETQSVSAMLPYGKDYLLGGYFFAYGGHPNANFLALWDGQSYRPFPGGGPNGPILAMTTIGPDLYIGGSFTQVGGVATGGIAKWNGVRWSALGNVAFGNVSALATDGVELFVGGSFVSAGGVAFTRSLARWDGAAWHAPSATEELDGPVFALRWIGTKLYVGGSFTTPGPAILRYNPSDQAFETMGAGATGGMVFAIDGVNEDSVYVGGHFSSIGAISCSNFAVFSNATGTFVLPIGLNPGFDVLAIAVASASEIYVASGTGVDRYDGASSATSVSGLGVTNTSVQMLRPNPDGGAFAGGNIFGSGTPTPHASFGRISAAAAFTSLDVGVPAKIHTVVFQGGDMYVGGEFQHFAGVQDLDHLAKWDGDTWSSPCPGSPDGPVYAIFIDGSDLIVGGSFLAVNAVPNTARIANCTNGSWQAMAGGLSGTVRAISRHSGYLLAGGEFTSLKKFNGAGWTGDSIGNHILAMAKTGNGDVILGGLFTDVGGFSDGDYIAKYDGTLSAVTNGTSIANLTNAVHALAADPANNDAVYVGGAFRAPSSPGDGILKLTLGAGWTTLGSGVGTTGSIVRSIALSDDGRFVHLGGTGIEPRISTYDNQTPGYLDLFPALSGAHPADVIALSPSGVLHVGDLGGLSVLDSDAVARDVTAFSPVGLGDDVHLAYGYGDGSVAVRTFDAGNGSWEGVRPLSGGATRGVAPSLATTTTGDLHVTWVETDGLHHDVHTGATWQAQGVVWNEKLRASACAERAAATGGILCLGTRDLLNGSFGLRAIILD